MEFHLALHPLPKKMEVENLFEAAASNSFQGLCIDAAPVRDWVFQTGLEPWFELYRKSPALTQPTLRCEYDLIRNQIEHTREFISDIAFAKEIESPRILATLTRVTASKNVREEEFEGMIESLEKVMPLAEKLKIDILLSFTPWHIVDTITSAKKFLQIFRDKRLHLSLDLYRIWKDCKLDPLLAFKTLEEHVKMVTIRMNFKDDFRRAENCALDYREIIERLDKWNWKGVVLLEGDEETDLASAALDLAMLKGAGRLREAVAEEKREAEESASKKDSEPFTVF